MGATRAQRGCQLQQQTWSRHKQGWAHCCQPVLAWAGSEINVIQRTAEGMPGKSELFCTPGQRFYNLFFIKTKTKLFQPLPSVRPQPGTTSPQRCSFLATCILPSPCFITGNVFGLTPAGTSELPGSHSHKQLTSALQPAQLPAAAGGLEHPPSLCIDATTALRNPRKHFIIKMELASTTEI